MKLSLYIVLFTITTQTIYTTITSAAEVIVRDSTGKKVLDNVRYGIGPVVSGGNIKLTNTDKKKKICPFNVVQDPNDNIGGEFEFMMIDSVDKYIKTSRVLGIGSGYNPKDNCVSNTVWTINDAESKAPDNLITTGGELGTEITCFQVEKYPKPTNAKVNSYMIQHCPNFCGGSMPKTCYNVSIYEHNGVKRLAAGGTNTPFEFVFYKLS